MVTENKERRERNNLPYLCTCAWHCEHYDNEVGPSDDYFIQWCDLVEEDGVIDKCPLTDKSILGAIT